MDAEYCDDAESPTIEPDQLRSFLAAAGWSPAELAARASVRTEVIESWLNGNGWPTGDEECQVLDSLAEHGLGLDRVIGPDLERESDERSRLIDEDNLK